MNQPLKITPVTPPHFIIPFILIFYIALFHEYGYAKGNIDNFGMTPVLSNGNGMSIYQKTKGNVCMESHPEEIRNQTFGKTVRLPVISWIFSEWRDTLWLTWLVKVFCLTIIITLLYAVIFFWKDRIKLKHQIRSLEEKKCGKNELDEEQLKFYTNIITELQTSLTLIIGTLEDIMSDPTIPSQYSSKLHMVHYSYTNLLNQINNIIEFRQTESRDKLLTMSKDNLELSQNSTNDNRQTLNGESRQKNKNTEKNQILSSLDKQFVDNLNSIIKDNLANPDLDVAYLSDKMHMSNSTLYRKVIATLGMSTKDYVRGIRMERVREMLVEGLYPITEIAYQCGFSNHSSFAKSFKKHFGMSASEYVAALKEHPNDKTTDSQPFS